MDVYSATLLIAIVAAGLALLGAIVTRLRAEPTQFTPAQQITGLLSVFLSLLAIGYHLGAGHRPGTPTALNIVDFLAAHPAPFVTMVVGTAATWLGRSRPFGPSQDV
jgi:hypothetical protein